MLSFLICLLAFLGLGVAQTTAEKGTGVRSLWIPYKTISGTPLASILDHDKVNNRTTYVISCPTGQAGCALAPNLTLTEGTDLAQWASTTSGASVGNVVISCPLTGSPVTCHQSASGGENIRVTQATVAASDIVYQAVDVTAKSSKTKDKKKDAKKTVTKKVTVTPSTTSTTPSTGGVDVGRPTGLPWALGGAVGAGLAVVAVL